MARLHVLIVVGTRPEAIKLAPVIAECRRRADAIRLSICFSGQHRELLQPVAEYFGITPDVDLGLMRRDQSLAELTARTLTGLDGVFDRFSPDCIVAQGDTTTVLCAALAAFYRRLPLVHVEAGLRTGDLAAPWPEEMNRRLATLAADLHCAPTPKAVDNLTTEGVSADRIVMTGNTVIDALLVTAARERANTAHWAAQHPELGSRRMVLITGHRRENHGENLHSICNAIQKLSDLFEDVMFLFPVHLNPHVQAPVRRFLADRRNVHLLAPVPYPEFVWLLDRSTLVITDSGGVQEEAPSLSKPVLVTRACTERPEAVECGAARLVGADVQTIVDEARLVLEAGHVLARPAQNPYGDGHAAERVVAAMLQRFERQRGVIGPQVTGGRRGEGGSPCPTNGAVARIPNPPTI